MPRPDALARLAFLLLTLLLVLGFPFVVLIAAIGLGQCEPPVHIVQALVAAAGAILAVRAIAASVAAIAGRVAARVAWRWTLRALATIPAWLILWELACEPLAT